MPISHASPLRASSFSLKTLAFISILCCAPPIFAQGPARQSASARSAAGLPAPSPQLVSELEEIYKDIHANPEIGFQERRTAKIAADWLRKRGFQVTEGVGGTGVVGLLRNGPGPMVMLRADMDALEMKEETGLPYASTKTTKNPEGEIVPVGHMCGHDMHVTWLMGATRVLAENRGRWKGTVMAVFQPAEEPGTGAAAMIKDGMMTRFPKPDIILGQHVLPMAAGTIGTRPGLLLSMSDQISVTFHGRGGHGSSPEKAIDPVVMAAASVMRLQTVVSRDLGITQGAVISVGQLNAGSSGNIIPSEATMELNVRSFDDGVRKTVLEGITRVVNAEAMASAAPKPPTITPLGRFPPTYNDAENTPRVVAALKQRLGDSAITEIIPASASEDFTIFARAWNVPSVYWAVGGVDPATYAKAEREGTLNDVPGNHSKWYAPVLNPTIPIGVDAMLAAATPWLAPSGDQR